MKNLLLIISAKEVSKDIQNIYGDIIPVLLPYKGKTLIESIYESNKDKFDIELICNKDNIKLRETVHNKNIKLNEIDVNENIEDSISKGEWLKYKNVTLLFGDTIIENFQLESYTGNKVAYNIVFEPEKWTTFKIEKEIKEDIKNMNQKEQEEYINFFKFLIDRSAGTIESN